MTWTTGWISLGCIVALLLACGGESGNGNSGGRSQGSAGNTTNAATAGTRASNGGSGGGSNVSGGAIGAGGANGNSGGTAVSGANAGGSGASSGGVGGTTSAVRSCNPANVLCDMAVPDCPSMQVPELSDSGNCYTGDCMPIGDCSCKTASDCPDRNQYTCRNDTQRCTPYL